MQIICLDSFDCRASGLYEAPKMHAAGFYRVGHENRAILLLSISSPIIDQFSTFFHRCILWTISNQVVIKYPATLLTVLLHYLVKYKCKKN